MYIHATYTYTSMGNSILRNQDQQTSFRECIALGLGLPLLTLKGKVIKDRSWLTDRMTCLSVGDQLCQPLYCQNKFMSLTKCNIFFCFTSGWLKMFLFTYMCKNLAVYYHFIMWRSIIQIHTMHMHGTQWCECADSTKHQAWHRTWKLLLRYSLSPRHGHGPSTDWNWICINCYFSHRTFAFRWYCSWRFALEDLHRNQFWSHTLKMGFVNAISSLINSPKLLWIHIWILHSSRSLQLLMMAGNCIAERKVRVGDFLKTSFHQVLLGSVSVQILQL